MRNLVVIASALALAGCWTPDPGQPDPTRYPRDQRKWQAAHPSHGTYCVMTMETGSATGITVGSNIMEMQCKEPQR